MRIEIDHVVVISDTPEADMEAVQGVTGLPELWPFTASETIQSGALWDGSTGIEFTRLEGARNQPQRLAGLAFKALLPPWDIAEQLRRDGLKHIPPTQTGPFGEPDFIWTTVMVGGLLQGEAKTLWLGPRFGGRRWFSRWMAAMGRRLSQTPSGQARLNSVLDEHLTFFVDYHARDRVAAQLATTRQAFADAGLARAGDRSCVTVELDLGSSARTNWETLLGAPIEDGSRHAAGDVDLEFRAGRQNRLVSFTLSQVFNRAALPGRLRRFLVAAGQ